MLLKELIKAKGIKQKWLAQKIGVSEITVSNWCTNKTVPQKHHIEKLCEILDIPEKNLLQS